MNEKLKEMDNDVVVNCYIDTSGGRWFKWYAIW